MRIAFIIPTLTLGGAQRSLVKAATLLYESEHDVHVIVLSDSRIRIDNELPEAVTVWHCHGGRSANPLLWWRVRMRLRRIRPSIVIGWSTYANLVAIVASRPWDRWRLVLSERIYVPAFLRTLGTSSHRRWLLSHLMRMLYPLASVVTANSTDNVRFLAKWVRHGCAFRQLPNIIDIDVVERLGIESAGSALDSRGLVILAAGRLVPQKGFDLLLRALAFVPKDISWRLEIIGQGSEESHLRQLAAEAGVADRVIWLRAQRNPFTYYRKADIVVVPSRFEGFPNTAMEAMATGRALICTDCRTGPRELSEKGKFAMLVPVENVEALASAITFLARNPEARRRLGMEARKHVADRYSSEVVRQIYLDSLTLHA